MLLSAYSWSPRHQKPEDCLGVHVCHQHWDTMHRFTHLLILRWVSWKSSFFWVSLVRCHWITSFEISHVQPPANSFIVQEQLGEARNLRTALSGTKVVIGVSLGLVILSHSVCHPVDFGCPTLFQSLIKLLFKLFKCFIFCLPQSQRILKSNSKQW